MVKKIFCLMAAVFLFSSVSFAGRLFVIDSPNARLINYGSYEVGFRFFGGGGVQTRLDFGVFKVLNLGIAWELDRFLGNDQIKVAVPALSVKLKLYGGDSKWPGVVLGYDGQGYFYNTDYDGDYVQRGKGVYFVIGREVFFDGLIANFGINMNEFKDAKLYCFLNAALNLYEERFFVLAEYDNLHSFSDARFNAGVRVSLTDAVDLDLFMRDCWGYEEAHKVPNERVFRLTYNGKF